MKPTKMLADRHQETGSNKNVGASFEFVVRAELPDSVETDFVHSIAGRVIAEPESRGKEHAGQLALLFQNLIGNALKFCGSEAPRIHIAAERQNSGWVLSVRDNGIGIDPQYFERIFVIFQRLHTRKEYPGTGMGLALCKKIVERHGGKIWLDSKVGMDTTFRFTLSGSIPEARP